MADTVKINLVLSSYLEDKYVDEISTIELKLITENTFPIKGVLQVYFVDDNNMILDSLFSSSISTVPQNNYADKTFTTTLIKLDKEKYKKIERSTKLFLRYSFSSASLSITEKNYLTVKSGIKISFSHVQKW